MVMIKEYKVAQSIHQVYALIEHDTVRDLRIFNSQEEATFAAQSTYPSGIAIMVSEYPVQIGDKYMNHSFYRQDGSYLVQISRTPTYLNLIDSLEGQLKEKLEIISILEERLNNDTAF